MFKLSNYLAITLVSTRNESKRKQRKETGTRAKLRKASHEQYLQNFFFFFYFFSRKTSCYSSDHYPVILFSRNVKINCQSTLICQIWYVLTNIFQRSTKYFTVLIQDHLGKVPNTTHRVLIRFQKKTGIPGKTV